VALYKNKELHQLLSIYKIKPKYVGTTKVHVLLL